MLREFLQSVVDLVLPPRRTERVLRTTTLAALQNIKTEEPLAYHDPRVTALVWELKYYANKRAAALAGALLAEELLDIAQEELGKPLLIPVPMHATRLRERGHNQTEVLCEASLTALSRPTKKSSEIFDYAPTILVRTRHTAPQQGLPKQVRLSNVKDSMEVKRPDLIAGRVCVVLDDVTTTGATLAECKRALKAAGAQRVHLLALARS